MSRIGKRPVPVPAKVTVTIDGQAVTVKGPKGELSRVLPEGIVISQEESAITVTPESESRRSRERHGLCRTLIANMIEGVTNGYQKRLEIQGVGYRAQVQGTKLNMSLGL
jgi:large subunit ribosomal protein L6